MKKIMIFMLCVVMSMTILSAQPSEWAVDSINKSTELKYIDERFGDDYQREITRGEFAYLGVRLYEILSNKMTTMGDAYFLDTFDEYVLRAKYNKIVKGYPDDTYKPENPITREELAVLFVNALKAADKNLKIENQNKFSDEQKIGEWARQSVYFAREYGIVKGIGNNTFAPSKKATVEQAIVMFKRAVDGFKDAPTLEPSTDANNNTEVPKETSTQENKPIKVENQPQNSTDKTEELNSLRKNELIGLQLSEFNYNSSGNRINYRSDMKFNIIHIFSSKYSNNVQSVETLCKIFQNYTNISVLFIDISDEQDDSIKKLADNPEKNMYFVNSSQTNFLNHYKITIMPTTFFVDSNRKIDDIIIGNSAQKIYMEVLANMY